MPTNYITLPRSKLYELVWTKPVTELAKEFGISDVALAKRCRSLNIPLPPRGYWARVAAGQSPKRPRLPLYHEVRGSGAARRTTGPAGEPVATFDPSRAAAKAHEEKQPLPALTTPPTTDLNSASAIVKRTARHYKHPQRADLTVARGEAQGPILHLHVSPDSLDRALLIADRFLRACAEQGFNPIPPKEPVPPDPRHYYGRPPERPKKTGPDFADLDVAGHRIEFTIEERYDQRELPPTDKDLARQKRDSWFRPEKRYETTWSGYLRLKRPGHHYPYGMDGKSWFETANRTLDALIPRILADFRAVATRMQEVDDKIERDRLERERLAKLAQEQAARRATNAKLIHELERQVGAWHRAKYLRRYLRAATRAVASGEYRVKVDSQQVEFLSWAEHYVNQLDPLHPEPRDPDLQHEPETYCRADEKRPIEELQRLVGHTWGSALKLVAASADTDDASDADDGEEDDED